MAIQGFDDVPYEPYEPDWDALAAADSEDRFGQAAFELLKEAGYSVSTAVTIVALDDDGEPVPLPRDAAIVGGLLVRCMKLQFGLLQSASERRMELINMFLRPLIESAVNLRFLLDHATPEICQDFVRYSLRQERRLRKRIEEHIAEQNGQSTPIQRRILASIDRAFDQAGVDVDEQPTGAWPARIWGRFDQLGLGDEYLLMFATQNHYLHGNWHDICAYHLRSVGDGFVLEPRWGDARPQPLFAATLILAEATERYLDVSLPPCDELNVLKERLAACTDRVHRVMELHEAFLTRELEG